MRLFSSDRVMTMMDSLGLDENTPIDAKILSGAVENAQRSVESRHFKSRKNVLEYDNVMNTQREVIYAQRQKVLAGEDLRQNMLGFLQDVISSTVSDALSQTGGVAEEDSLKAALSRLEGSFFPKGAYRPSAPKLSAEELSQEIYALALRYYEAKETAFTPEMMREVERVVMLRMVSSRMALIIAWNIS